MHRFYLPEAKSAATLVLMEREAHHAANVLRLREGESVTVLDGMGTEFICKVQTVSKKTVTLSVLQKNEIAHPPCQITLLQAVPKGKLIDTIIQKATELGVNRIVPLLTERVVTQVGDERAEAKREKWQQVAIEAIKQCGQTWLPKVESPVSITEFLRKNETFDLPLIASLQPGSRHPHTVFSEFRQKNHREPQTVAIWIGPEGDFTSTEVQEIIARGTSPITLGRLTLRCETAAIYCLSIVNYEMHSP